MFDYQHFLRICQKYQSINDTVQDQDLLTLIASNEEIKSTVNNLIDKFQKHLSDFTESFSTAALATFMVLKIFKKGGFI